MRSKWGKFLFNTRLVKLQKTFISTLFLSVLAIITQSSQVHATVTVVPACTTTNCNYATSEGSIRYAGTTTGTLLAGAIDSADGFKIFNFSKGVAGGSPDTSQMLLFDVKSDKDFAVGQQVVVTIVTRISSGATVAIPIAAASYATGTGLPDTCTGSTCQGSGTANGITYALSARYNERSTLRVGIYLRDLCNYSFAGPGGGASTFCVSSAGITDPTATTPTLIPLTFFVSVAPDSVSVGATDTAQSEQLAVQLGLHAQGVSYTCPSGLANAYFPGDGQIFVNPGIFTITRSGGEAPVSNLIVIANEGIDSLASVSASNFYQFQNVARVASTGNDLAVQNFVNSEVSGVDHPYDVAFTFRDAAGIVSPVLNAVGNCRINNVRTSKILGFLKKNSCFIATGAFRSEDAAPILLLRRFRNEVLSRFQLGRELRDFYYEWSPRAGLWLMENPEWRYPVLRLLLPVQAIAWLLMQPLLFFFLLASGASVIFLGLRRRA